MSFNCEQSAKTNNGVKNNGQGNEQELKLMQLA